MRSPPCGAEPPEHAAREPPVTDPHPPIQFLGVPLPNSTDRRPVTTAFGLARHRGTVAEGGDAAAEVKRSRRNQAQNEGSLGAGEPWSGSVAALRDHGTAK